MPLAFESTSHGRIAFGFINIDSDMLLLEHHFFFAEPFCAAIEDLAGCPAGRGFGTSWPGYVIERAGDVGDLMGAIHGERFTGFIGETYRRYPFPAREEDFRQKPEGHETRAEFEEMIRAFGERAEIRLSVSADGSGATLAGYAFTSTVLEELVRYVRRGGWPRWRDNERPLYVQAMDAAVAAGGHSLFQDRGSPNSD